MSLLTYEEQSGTVYKDNGRPEDALQILKSHGWNCLRLRLWVHPTGQGIFVNDLPYTVALGGASSGPDSAAPGPALRRHLGRPRPPAEARGLEGSDV